MLSRLRAVLGRARRLVGLRGDGENLASPFAIRGCDYGRVGLDEVVLGEEGCDVGNQLRAETQQQGIEGASCAQMRQGPQELRAVILFLQRIGSSIVLAHDLDSAGVQLVRLLLPGRTLLPFALDGDGGAGRKITLRPAPGS